MFKDKLFTAEGLKKQVDQWRSEGHTVAFTNGVFDLLHLGHIAYLEDASGLAGKLIVAVNSDTSVKQLNKGPARPIKDEQTRAAIMAALEAVDAVVLFSENTPYELIKELQPDVLIKGGDYDPDEADPASKKYIVGSDIVRKKGGRVVVIPFIPGHSSTALEKKILILHGCKER